MKPEVRENIRKAKPIIDNIFHEVCQLEELFGIGFYKVPNVLTQASRALDASTTATKKLVDDYLPECDKDALS